MNGDLKSEKAAPTRHLTFRTDIEGLRAIAVLLVVLGHAGVPFLSGGYIGVDVFFVISGFLITLLLLTELRNTGTISIRRFYARRMVRLLPAAAAVLVTTLVAAWWWLPGTRYGSILIDAISSVFYLVNYRLAFQGTDYLAADEPPSPFQHLWSLSVEEQFYLVWPLLLLITAFVSQRHRRRLNLGPIFALLFAMTAISLIISIVQTQSMAPWAYFGTHTRAWELAIGAIVALAVYRERYLPRVLAAVIAWVGLAGIVVSSVVFSGHTAFPGWVAALPVLSTAFVIYGGTGQRHGVTWLLSLPPLTAVGAVSYGWYLWHWPVLLIGPVAFGVEPSLGVNMMLVAGSLCIAALSYRFLENPIRRQRWLTRKSRRGLGLGIALSSGMAVVISLGFVFIPPTTGTGDAAGIDGEEINESELADLLASGIKINDVPANLTPSLENIKQDIPPVYADGCHADFDAVEPNSDCVYGDSSADRTMVLFGDSHAAHWFPALEKLAFKYGWRLLSLTKSACVAPMVTTYVSALERNYDECVQWRKNTLSYIKKQEPEIVIMPVSDGGEPVDTDTPDSDWVSGFINSFEAVAGPNTKLVHIADTPWLEENVADCLAVNLSTATACVQPLEDALVQPERRSATNDALRANGVTVIDPLAWFCTDTACPVIIENVLMYRDRHHISATYAETLAPLLAGQLGL
ncbi:peptidoglycan/LPS O-acetylase OafA/YrhL [Stackebrandtia endophytica]|uniref:Peptidoglycan/LPS O-acetylase OafA/YrhL n=1 Tax=Stackebrandtia endophytica TaxID=1496996 RepID=A0A543AZM6_9ACTN|nr:acyltransferase family protein [Stackebrandtia endophytica]TQL78021.1 peptidoglycan/LPS O-acetylase OafA/YrhL [Stackebrandtia endophytica]